MATFGERLRYLRENKGYKQTELTEMLSLSSSATISQYESNKRIPDAHILEQLSDIFNCSIDFLLGKSNKYINNYLIPLLGTIRAGLPLLAEDNWEGEVEVPSDLKADYALRVIGDSMSWVGIHEGDLAILRQNEDPSSGMIVAVGVEDSEWTATLKFYIEENGKKILRAGNPEYEDIVIGKGHRIIGQVVSIQKETPTLQTYREHLLSKEITAHQWKDAIEKAVQSGLDGTSVKKMIELYADMIKKI